MSQRVLVIGSGAREHALAWKLAQSPNTTVYIAPGNAGTESVGYTIDIPAVNYSALAEFAQQENIDVTVVGPDNPLAEGIVDHFQKRGLAIFGPTKSAAYIESSKSFAKRLMRACDIRTAPFESFTDFTEAISYCEAHPYPLVIKASGLALGKGVYICTSHEEVLEALDLIMVRGVHGKAGSEVVVETYLEGEEFSIHALSDGKSSRMLLPVQDYKRIFVGNTGPNTGGMGSYAPIPWVNNLLLEEVRERAVQPLLRALADRNQPFVGCLYPGAILTSDGVRILEYNARFGDPETQSLMKLLESDLYELLLSCVQGNVASQSLEWHEGYAVSVVLASEGYPGIYSSGRKIHGIRHAEQIDGVTIFHAGTRKEHGTYLTCGGRVMTITAHGDTLAAARERAYAAVETVSFEGMHYRTDIAHNPTPFISRK